MATINENLKEALLNELSGKNRFADVITGNPYLQVFYDGDTWDVTFKPSIHGDRYDLGDNERWIEIGMSDTWAHQATWEHQITASEEATYYELDALAQQIIDLYEDE